MNSESSAKALGDIIEGKEFNIPMYQRNYKWSTVTTRKLVDNVISCYEKSKSNQEIKKSLGLITLYEKGKNKYDIIDGQQRFITIAILLSILGSETINLKFERDPENSLKRVKAIMGNSSYGSTDINRIKRNKGEIEEIINNFFKEKEDLEKEKEDLARFILNNVIILHSIVKDQPIEEFMNLNAYKTAFSICDYIRANLISLNSFYKEELEKDVHILARSLSKHSYKTAVAILYNNIQEKLYYKDNVEGEYKSIYKLLNLSKAIIEPKNESRINILFNGLLDDEAENYDSGEIVENSDYWIKMLQKLAYINKLLDELKSELNQGEFHSFKQIDDYQSLTKKSFVREVFDGISNLDKGWDSKTLAKEIQKYSNIDSVLIKQLNKESKKLANRYLEAFVYSSINDKTNKKADSDIEIKNNLNMQTEIDEFVAEIGGCGRYIIDRYELEHREDLNINIVIPPVMDLEDRENINFGGSLDELNENDDLCVGDLFKHDIIIPVIQRDYCMGARVTGENDFISFLMDGFNKSKDNLFDSTLSASTILISVSAEKNDKKVYIFDGQQRIFTLFNILKHCSFDGLKDFSFVGRETRNKSKEKSKIDDKVGSPYSKEAVYNLIEVLDKKIKKEDKGEFAKYISKKVFFKVKTVENVSGAEQFFMDINGGVALEKYEVYKAMLCSRLSFLKREDIVRKIENEWLDSFYRYRIEYLKIKDIETDERDEEELLEIRFIEYVCRFIYRMNHYGITYKDIWKYDQKDNNIEQEKQYKIEYNEENKSLISVEIDLNEKSKDKLKLLTFDEIKSKSEIVAKLGYINELTEEDIKQIERIMDCIVQEQFIQEDVELCDKSSGNFRINSYKGNKSSIEMLYICTKDDCKGSILSNKHKYLNRFIWSLSDNNRKRIKNYYKYREISDLIKIYDNDQIMRDILLSCIDNDLVKGDKYIHNIDSGLDIKIYGGYKNKGSLKSFNELSEKKIPKKEVPVYYWRDIPSEGVNVLPLCYFKDKSNSSNINVLHFALIDKGIKCL